MPRVASFRGIELKLFYELGGLFDLRSTLTEFFSPNRAAIALHHFNELVAKLIDGRHGQASFSEGVERSEIAHAFATFRQQIIEDNVPVQQEKQAFNQAASALLQAVANVAVAAKPNATAFMEKTPHNLLQPAFLKDLAPKGYYIHVSRNPKAIAASVARQPWGPSHLPGAIRWVKSYFASWEKVRESYATLGLPLLELRIEDVAANTAAYSAKVHEFLGFPQGEDVFAPANLEVLGKWGEGRTPFELKLLDAEFAGLCTRLGY
ncbi:hypothetical protein DGI_4028 (plasmid) [Megalodesulfovibrio gigas DSM 1382 = ATCC 19364]|uniref:Sulfotransferase n=2 Tax=Megalodesulfovibrio gigas TaxID=879 RepID=T2GGI5_MEGG1|nr:hypothetical protein DGI_4028 [Megalodesulfovibrio gigas DSM 1382 = ATCC 19364]